MVAIYELSILSDILKNFKVKNIIINGLSEKNLVEEILKYDANITAIDSTNQTNSDIEVINEIPLKILSDFKNYDAIFINDDPNWYTVYNQLDIIKKSNDEFPLVFICNNRFPHKHRDSYINPDNIPPEFRQDFSKELPINYNGQNILIKDNFYHATSENTPKNGVSTAIEDFLKENKEISEMNIQLINEITILYPKSTISKIRIDKIMKDIEDKTISSQDLSSTNSENQILLSYLSENNYSLKSIKDMDNLKKELSEQNNEIDNLKDKIKNQDNEIEYKNSKIEGVESQLSLKDTQIKSFETKLINKDIEIENLTEELDNLKDNLKKQEIEHERVEKILQAKINEQQIELENTEETLQAKINEQQIELENTEETLQAKINQQKIEYNHSEELLQSRLNEKLNVINNIFNNFENQIDDLIESNTNNLENKQKSLDILQKQNTYLHSKIDSREYCISCFKEEISNNKIEIQYLKNNKLTRTILSPLSYLFILLKSNPREISLNFKLYNALKNSKCFDIGFYLKNNKDLQRSKWCKYFSPELHYICNGFDENREFNKKYFNRNSKKELLEYLITCEEK